MMDELLFSLGIGVTQISTNHIGRRIASHSHAAIQYVSQWITRSIYVDLASHLLTYPSASFLLSAQQAPGQMAEPVGLASGVLALAGFAFKAGIKLRDTIQEFQNQPRQVRELLTELAGLVLVLQKLSKISDLGLDVDITALRLTLEQCKRSCDEVEAELLTYCSRSVLDRTSFRDWAKLRCSGGDGIEGFRQQLIGYKSTITVALSFANLLVSLGQLTKCSKLRICYYYRSPIQQKLEALAQRSSAGPGLDKVTQQRMEEEQRSTEKGLEFCATLSQAIEKIQVDFFGGKSGLPNLASSDSTSGMLLGEGLDGCMHHMRFTLDQLEKHRKKITESLGTGSAASMSAQDQASLNKLQAEEKTLQQCLNFCSDVDAVLESQVSNIENNAEGDDSIQLMVSTDGKRFNGKNRGIGLRLKQAGGHFSEGSLQQVSQDFKAISIHYTGIQERAPGRSTPMAEDNNTPPQAESPFGNRHGPGVTLAKHGVLAGPAGWTGGGS
ncbi:uncharacterized protein JN550_007917 [Neoarthrinium moseri]|uniref:uncharacterized protein n=1 Tax=Neoarthrinium moseri TaxID=1658444 RepID=UPI001FDC63F1|nr:uncharacterized protein JN550_007917 [Neoarthrinium moseri]KAI1865939.1 hypothetical protein JN550_007917 [Neoarthrinium moseri]